MWVIAITLNDLIEKLGRKNWEKNWGRKTGDAIHIEKLGTQYIFTCFCREKTGDAKNWPKTENFLMTSGDKKVFIHLDCPL